MPFEMRNVLSNLFLLLSAGLFYIFALPSPLFGTPGPESAYLLTCMLLPALCIKGALLGARRGEKGFVDDLYRALFWIALMVLVTWGLTFLRSFWGVSCLPHRSGLYFLTLFVPSVLLGTCISIIIGRLIGRPLMSVLFVSGSLLLYLYLQYSHFMSEPSFRVMNHLFVVIESDLLQGVSPTTVTLLFRLSTFSFACAVILFGLLWFKSNTRFGLGSYEANPSGLYGVLIVLIVLGFYFQSASLQLVGKTRSELRADYSNLVQKGVIRLHSDPYSISQKNAQNLLEEAYFWLTRLEKRLEITSSEPIDIWVHVNQSALKRYTGASHVHFALPKHREIHIASTRTPHPTLGHELAHILLGELNSNIMGLPGRFFFLPNMGLSEGLAVVLTPELELDYDLTLQEKGAAIVQNIPQISIASLFSLNPWHFSKTQPRSAYVLGASFLSFALDQISDNNPRKRAALIRKLAKSGTLEAVLGEKQTRESLIASYTKSASELELPLFASQVIRDRFQAKSYLSEVCTAQGKKDLGDIRYQIATMDFDPILDSLSNKPLLEANQLRFAMMRKAQEEENTELLKKLIASFNNSSVLQGFSPAQKDVFGNHLYVSGAKQKALLLWKKISLNELRPHLKRGLHIKIKVLDTLLNETLYSGHLKVTLNLLTQTNGRSGVYPYAALGFEVGLKYGTQYTSKSLGYALSLYVHARAIALAGSPKKALRYLLALEEDERLASFVRLEIRRLIGLCYQRLGKPDRAKAAYESVLETAHLQATRFKVLEQIARF